jgi:hypothetical protein
MSPVHQLKIAGETFFTSHVDNFDLYLRGGNTESGLNLWLLEK